MKIETTPLGKQRALTRGESTEKGETRGHGHVLTICYSTKMSLHNSARYSEYTNEKLK